MKKPFKILLSVLLVCALLGGLVLVCAGSRGGTMTQQEDWRIASDWTARPSPSGLWMEYTQGASSMEGLQLAQPLSGSFELSYYLFYRHGSTIVDCNTVKLRKQGADEYLLLRLKGCNLDFMLEAQHYSGSFQNLVQTDWIQDPGSLYNVRLSHTDGTDTLRVTILAAGKTVYETELTQADFFDAPLLFSTGCEEGNLAITNFYRG